MPVAQPIVLCSYTYDAVDRLADYLQQGKADTQRFYRKNRLTTEIQGQVLRSMFEADERPLAQLQPGNPTVLLATDQQRSVLQASDGVQPQTITYSPYGHHHSQGGLLSLLAFNGERPDPVTGRYHLGNGYRAFSPVLMRFDCPDSMSPFGKGGLNPYAYCLGDPINFTDPTGHLPWWAWVLIGVGAVVFIPAIIILAVLSAPVIAGAAGIAASYSVATAASLAAAGISSQAAVTVAASSTLAISTTGVLLAAGGAALAGAALIATGAVLGSQSPNHTNVQKNIHRAKQSSNDAVRRRPASQLNIPDNTRRAIPPQKGAPPDTKDPERENRTSPFWIQHLAHEIRATL